eukprot:3073399-Amphidinium_carterae.1
MESSTAPPKKCYRPKKHVFGFSTSGLQECAELKTVVSTFRSVPKNQSHGSKTMFHKPPQTPKQLPENT